jgi:nicotinamide phosphoribosyltransferase
MSFEFNPACMEDFYKSGHPAMLLPNTTVGYSNFTPRSTHRDPAPVGPIWFGYQAWRDDFLIRQWNDNFFNKDRKDVVGEYDELIKTSIGPDADTSHIGHLHDLGYLPILIKGLPEGSLIPYRVPALTIRSTHEKFAWLPNKLESTMSNNLWLPPTSATTSFLYRKEFDAQGKRTGTPKELIPFLGHDFSMRGMEGDWAAAASGAAHLLSFSGTDTETAILFLRKFYRASGFIGGSVTATEHWVTCAGAAVMGEFEYLKYLITVVKPKGIISVVSDTWDLWKVLTEYLPALKDIILARDGKVVIRPDSGGPVKILCGDDSFPVDSPPYKGVVQLLWEVIGGSVNSKGFKVLDPHIGSVYGDSITLDRKKRIGRLLEAKGFDPDGVLGIGSFTFQYVTRDTDGWAMKGTYTETDGIPYNLSKSPVTDSGSKNSASGLLRVDQTSNGFSLKENCTWAEEAGGALQTTFKDSKAEDFQTYDEIKDRMSKLLEA